MSQIGPEGRSYAPIDLSDLRRLASIARDDLSDFFARHRDWAELYQHRLLGFTLAQGAANHYIGRGDGVQDFDVYALFATHPKRLWYAKRHAMKDFGDAKFGQSIGWEQWVGRRVDLLGRGLQVEPGADLALAVRSWLAEGRTESAKLLALKAVVRLSPDDRVGEVIWS